jgi:hypothetical protein
VVISVTRLAYADATAQTAASVTATILDSVSAVRVG